MNGLSPEKRLELRRNVFRRYPQCIFIHICNRRSLVATIEVTTDGKPYRTRMEEEQLKRQYSDGVYDSGKHC